MRFNFRGQEFYLRPSKHSHIWVVGGRHLMIAKFIRIEIDTLIQLLDGGMTVIGYLSASTLTEVRMAGHDIPLMGERYAPTA